MSRGALQHLWQIHQQQQNATQMHQQKQGWAQPRNEVIFLPFWRGFSHIYTHAHTHSHTHTHTHTHTHAHTHTHTRTKAMMMVIAFITFNSSLVPLIGGLCSSFIWEFEFSGFWRNRTDDLGIKSPSLWPTEPRLHMRSDHHQTKFRCLELPLEVSSW